MVEIIVSPTNVDGIGGIASKIHPLKWAVNTQIALDANGYTVDQPSTNPFGTDALRVNGPVTYVAPWPEGGGSRYTMRITEVVYTDASPTVPGATNTVRVTGLDLQYDFGVTNGGFIGPFNGRDLFEAWDTMPTTVVMNDRGNSTGDFVGGTIAFPEGPYTFNAFGGADTFLGGAGADDIRGGAGNDSVSGAGRNDTLYGQDGNDTLDGGAGLDYMEGGTGDDTFLVNVAGELTGPLRIIGGDGLDTVRTTLDATLAEVGDVENLVLLGALNRAGTGNDLANQIGGNTGSNLLQGLAGNDTLSGGAGNDTLLGGAGADRLTGGTGADAFRFAAPAEGIDRIQDFNRVQGDRIEVSAAGFGGGLLQGVALTAAQFVTNTSGLAQGGPFGQFVYESDAGRLWWDANGTAAGGRAQVVVLSGIPALQASDIVVIA